MQNTSFPDSKRHYEILDGLRGVAAIMVLLFHIFETFTMGEHLHQKYVNHGYLAVDFFFVLSGFLITGILRRSRTEPFYWRRFYIKRATRILPPLVLGVAVAALFWPHASLLGAAGYLLSLANCVDMTRFAIYPIGHLWSLSV